MPNAQELIIVSWNFQFNEVRAGSKMPTATITSSQAAEIMDLPVVVVDDVPKLPKMPSLQQKPQNVPIEQYQTMPMKPLALRKVRRKVSCFVSKCAGGGAK